MNTVNKNDYSSSPLLLSSPERRIALWVGIFALLCGVVWLLGDVLLPFVLGVAIAYLVNPLADRIESAGLSRRGAALALVGGFFVAVGAALGVAVPLVLHEAIQFAGDVPAMIEKGREAIAPWTGWIQDRLNATDTDRLRAAIESRIGDAAGMSAGLGSLLGGGLLAGLQAGGQALAGFLTLVFITPIVSFFAIREWPEMTRWLRDLLPRRHAAEIGGMMDQINTRLSGFVRGQIMVCAILGTFYAVALSLAGLRYGLLIGLGAGVLSIIPMVGSTIGLLTALVVAWFQSGDWVYVATVGGIFVGGQLVEGNFLTPKIVGDRVGLHPLWIMLALMAGGALLGIVGMLLAVPAAIVVSVLSAFFIRRYKASLLYKDATHDTSPDSSDSA